MKYKMTFIMSKFSIAMASLTITGHVYIVHRLK